MADDTLFELPEQQAPKPELQAQPDEARVYRPDRSQLEYIPRNLDSAIPEDHVVRAVWAMVEKLNLAPFYASIKAVYGRPGHPATDPRVLLALWVYATVEGVGSARQLARLCEEHDAYRWLRGGVPINYHMLSDFRVEQQAALDDLLTQIVGRMMREGLVTLNRVSQDGMRTRASAGASSFKRRPKLHHMLDEAREQVKRLAQEREHPDPGINLKAEAARLRAARERERRIEAALEKLPEVEETKAKQNRTLSKDKRDKVSEPRVSTTDPEAKVTKMPDGGFRPAHNLELATDVDSQVVVGVSVAPRGSDFGEAPPMVEQIRERTGELPKAYLMDGGFTGREDITQLERDGIPVYAPVRPPRTDTSGRGTYDPRPDDTAEVAQWRARMASDEAKAIYKQRAATSECVNARARQCGLTRLLVRGTGKVLSMLLLVAISHNLLRWLALMH